MTNYRLTMTAEKQLNKILDYINQDEQLEKRVTTWIKEIRPDVKEKSIDLEIQKTLGWNKNTSTNQT